MKKITIKVEWCGKNYSGHYADDALGVIVATGKTIEEFKKEFSEAMDFHIEGLIEDGDDIPQWALTKQYEIDYDFSTSEIS